MGSISSVKISPDMRQVVITGDGVLGRHTTFTLDKPYRLVVDFDSTALGNMINRIKLERPPISEIRLGKLQNRARLVIDFGDFPVPAYAIERSNNVAVIALGESNIPITEKIVEPIREKDNRGQKHQAQNLRPIQAKKEASSKIVESVPAPTPIEKPATEVQTKKSAERTQSEQSVKKAALSNDLLIVEIQDPENPGRTYSIAIDIDFKNQTLRSASLSGSHGEIKRFDISELEDSNLPNQEKMPSSINSSIGPRRLGVSNTVFQTRPMEKPRSVFNSKPYVTSIQPPEGPDVHNPLKMEEFKLEVRKDR